jgi:hypothetical protein
VRRLSPSSETFDASVVAPLPPFQGTSLYSVGCAGALRGLEHDQSFQPRKLGPRRAQSTGRLRGR